MLSGFVSMTNEISGGSFFASKCGPLASYLDNCIEEPILVKLMYSTVYWKKRTRSLKLNIILIYIYHNFRDYFIYFFKKIAENVIIHLGFWSVIFNTLRYFLQINHNLNLRQLVKAYFLLYQFLVFNSLYKIENTVHHYNFYITTILLLQ